MRVYRTFSNFVAAKPTIQVAGWLWLLVVICVLGSHSFLSFNESKQTMKTQKSISKPVKQAPSRNSSTKPKAHGRADRTAQPGNAQVPNTSRSTFEKASPAPALASSECVRLVTFADALDLLHRNFDDFDTAAHPGSEPDGFVSVDDLRAVRDNHANPELREAARILLDNDELRRELAHADLNSENSQISRGDIRMFKFQHQHDNLNKDQMRALVEQMSKIHVVPDIALLDYLDALEQASPETRQMFYEAAMNYALENSDTPEGQRAAAFAMQALSQQSGSEVLSNLASLGPERLEKLTEAALKGQAASWVPAYDPNAAIHNPYVLTMDGVEKLMDKVRSYEGDWRVNDEGRDELSPEMQRVKNEAEAVLFAKVMDMCMADPAMFSYVSQNTQMKDALALSFPRNFDAMVESSMGKIDPYTGYLDTQELNTVSTFFNIISTPPPSKYTMTTINRVADKMDEFVKELKNLSPEQLNEDEWKNRAQALGGMLGAMVDGLSATLTSIVAGMIAADQATKDMFNLLISVGTMGAGNMVNGVAKGIGIDIGGAILAQIIDNFGGEYTIEDAADKLKSEHGISLSKADKELFSDYASLIEDGDIRRAFLAGVFQLSGA